jgi:hypothetical protein
MTGGTGGFVVVNLHQFVLDKKANAFVHEHTLAETTMGMSIADLNAFTLNSDKVRMKTESRKFLFPSMVKKIEENSLISMGGVDIERVEKFASDEKYEKFTVNWGFAYTMGYRIDKVFEEIDMLFRSGRDIDVIATSPGSRGHGTIVDWERFNYFTFMEKVPQEEFWKVISKCHAFVFMPDATELSYSVLEQQFLGLVGVFIDKDYLEGLLYPGYPFVAKNHEEIALYLRRIYENYEDLYVQEVIDKQRQWVRDNFDIEDRNNQIFNKMREKYEELRISYSDKAEKVQKMFRDIFGVYDGQTIDHEMWVKEVKEKSESKMNMLDCGGRFDQTKNKFRRLMQMAGYRDLCGSEDPVFKKKE